MMNERIKNLSKKAWLLAHEANDQAEEDEGEELTEAEFNNVFQQKFAESIVKECLDIIKSNTYGPAGEYDYSYTDKCVAADERAETIYNEIQQHFGVDIK